MKVKDAYPVLIETNKTNITLLFQRLNYFFIATAFLIAGFASSYATARANELDDVLWIAYVLIGIGIIISLFFTVINYLNGRIIYEISKHIMKLEILDFESDITSKEAPSIKLRKITRSAVTGGMWKLLGELLSEIYYIGLVFVFQRKQLNNIRKAEKSIASHVYLLPFGFTLSWIIILILAIALS